MTHLTKTRTSKILQGKTVPPPVHTATPSHTPIGGEENDTRTSAFCSYMMRTFVSNFKLGFIQTLTFGKCEQSSTSINRPAARFRVALRHRWCCTESRCAKPWTIGKGAWPASINTEGSLSSTHSIDNTLVV